MLPRDHVAVVKQDGVDQTRQDAARKQTFHGDEDGDGDGDGAFGRNGFVGSLGDVQVSRGDGRRDGLLQCGDGDALSQAAEVETLIRVVGRKKRAMLSPREAVTLCRLQLLLLLLLLLSS